jgi:hypothetical protein
MSVVLYCQETITQISVMISSTETTDIPQCSSGWVQAAYALPFDLSQIDPLVVSEMFGGGFLLFLVPWASSWGFSQLLKLLR